MAQRSFRTLLTLGRTLLTLGVSALLLGPAAAGADDVGGKQGFAVESELNHARAAFQKHARGWMADLEKNEARNRSAAPVYSMADEVVIRFDGYGDDFETQVKPTGEAKAPYIGILRYTENTYTCLRDGSQQCTVTRTVPVSEIFSFRNGRWTY